MSSSLKGSVLALAMFMVSMEPGITCNAVSDQARQLAKANNAFATHLYKTLLAGNESENLFFSPLSISTALAMTHLGARGTSSTQMSEVLHFDLLEASRMHHSFKELNKLLYGSGNKYTLKSANKLYGKSHLAFSPDFLDGTEEFYNAAFEGVADFSSPGVAERINDWVAKQTEGKIADLIAPGTLDTLTRLILVNAIYFKGNWATQFDAEDTQPGVFKIPHERVELNMMRLSGKFQMTDDKDRRCFVLELPYEDEDLSMLAVLPWDDDGLSSLEDQLSPEVLESWDADLEEEKVKLQFPRFKLEAQFGLSSALSLMGMSDAFSSQSANFEGITGDRSLHLSEVAHKAFIEVNEEGSEAAAATFVRLSARSIDPSRPYSLKFDHPFLFLIRDRRTKAVLFMGRMVDPPLESIIARNEL